MKHLPELINNNNAWDHTSSYSAIIILMKIDGKQIAAEMYEDLKKRVGELSITPHLVVILIGDDPASKVYVGQKQKWGEYIDAKVTILTYESTITTETLVKKIHQLNTDPYVHGLITQRPFPKHIDIQKIIQAIDPQKDVDGFHPDSPFEVPVALAVMRVLEQIYSSTSLRSNNKFMLWLHGKKIVVLGKGETAGKPIINLLQKSGIRPEIVDSKTQEPEKIIKNADIIISAVGKYQTITSNMIKKGAILMSIGLGKSADGKLYGDYISEDIKEKAAYYTPVTGGIGPMNVAYLLDNLIKATEALGS